MATQRRSIGDERAEQFDVRVLETGDVVEIYLETAQRWRRGSFCIGATGLASVMLADGSCVGLAEALRMGLRRVLN